MIVETVADYKSRIHFSRLAELRGVDGVAADWRTLRDQIEPHLLRGKKRHFSQTVASRAGAGELWLSWSKGNDALSMEIFVSGVGYAPAHEQLLYKTTQTQMTYIPYQAGPADLGDLAVHCPSDAIAWVYRNVCVKINEDHHSPVDVEPLARTVQRFMAAHHVDRVAERLPRVDRIEVSARQIRVGEPWTVTIGLRDGTPADTVLVQIEEVLAPKVMLSDEGADDLSEGDPLFQCVADSDLSATFEALAPGTARFDVRVVDRKTLLASPRSVTVEVLPAP